MGCFICSHVIVIVKKPLVRLYYSTTFLISAGLDTNADPVKYAFEVGGVVPSRMSVKTTGPGSPAPQF
jgi:hypothetical protein